jgi:hypothetical protein
MWKNLMPSQLLQPWQPEVAKDLITNLFKGFSKIKDKTFVNGITKRKGLVHMVFT